jgi:ribosome biogenesis protein ENP2
MAGLGGMKVTDMNGVKVYTVSGQKSFASWLAPDKKRSLRKDAEYLRRIELVQDLQFDTASTRLKATPDGQYLIASGSFLVLELLYCTCCFPVRHSSLL